MAAVRVSNRNVTPLAKEEVQGCHLLGTAMVFLWVIPIPSIPENILHERDEEAESVRKKDISDRRRPALLSSRWGKLSGALRRWGNCTLSMLSINPRIILLYPLFYLSVSGCDK